MKNTLPFLSILILIGVLMFQCKKAPEPVIDSVELNGGTISLFGENLNYWEKVKLNDLEVDESITVNSEGELMNVPLPTNLEPGVISVSILFEEGESNIKTFTLTAPISMIDSISQNIACVGDTLVISGKDFPLFDTKVRFFNSQTSQEIFATDILLLTDTLIKVLVPDPQGILFSHLQIIGDNGSSNDWMFGLSVPNIESINPNPVFSSTTSINIVGTNFKENGEVFLSGISSPLNATLYSNTLITVDLVIDPNTNQSIVVKNINGESSPYMLEVQGNPTIDNIFNSEYYVSPNCEVKLTGMSLNLITSLNVNQTPVVFTSQTTNALTFSLPPNTGATYTINYFTADPNFSGELIFQNVYDNIKSIIPENAKQGEPIFIYGNNLDIVESLNFNSFQIQVGADSDKSAQYIPFPIDSYARQHFGSDGFIVTRVPEVSGNAVEISTQLKDSDCISDTKNVNIISTNNPFSGTGPHGVPIPYVPPGVLVNSFGNQYLISLNGNFSSDPAFINSECPNFPVLPTDSCNFTENASYEGFFLGDGSFASISHNNQVYIGSQSRYNMGFIDPNDTTIFSPTQFILYGQATSSELIISRPGIIRPPVLQTSTDSLEIQFTGKLADGSNSSDMVRIYSNDTDFPLTSLLNTSNLITSLPYQFDGSNNIFTIKLPLNFPGGTYKLLVDTGFNNVTNYIEIQIP